MSDLTASAKRIIDSNQYMTLGTADREGRPWASPVWFAHEEDRAEQGIAVFSSRSRNFGGGEWTAADVRPGARLRLYLATASAQFVLSPDDERIPVSLA